MARTKYTLIERDGYHATAVDHETLAEMQADGVTITAQRPVTQAEIKRDRIHVYPLDAYREHRDWERFEQRFKGVVFKARVLWFDRLQGVGAAVGLNGEGRWTLYACNIAGKRTLYPETACVFHEEGQIIDVELHPYHSGSLLVSYTPGTLDQAKWDALDQDRLAFKCDASGNAINGLFA